MPEGLDQARDAFAQELNVPDRQRDQAGRFVSTRAPEPIFQPREVEGDERGDTRDGGADPRLAEQERRIADGRSEEGDERRSAQDSAARVRGRAANQGDDRSADDQPPERVGQKADDAAEDDEGPDKGAGSEQEPEQDPDAPKYAVEVDGEKREVTLDEALRGYQREETFNHRMRQMVEVAKAIDQQASEARQTRDAFIALCQRQEQEIAALIPKEPDWDALFKQDPQAAHALQKNFQTVYGTLNTIRSRRAQAEQQAYAESAQRTANYASSEFGKFCAANKLSDQQSVDKAIGYMRRTALEAGFSEDEIGSTYDSRMLSILHKAARFDNMMRNKPLPVQPERGGALQPGSAPRIGNSQARMMGDAQKRLASTGRVEDAAQVFQQMLRR